MKQLFYVTFQIILLAKVTLTTQNLLDQNGCKVLAVLCLKDPTCGDAEVFYEKCLERLSANFEPYRNLIGFEKVLSNPVTFLSLALFSNHLDKNTKNYHKTIEKETVKRADKDQFLNVDNRKDRFSSDHKGRDQFLSDANRKLKKEIVNQALEIIQKLLNKDIKPYNKELSKEDIHGISHVPKSQSVNKVLSSPSYPITSSDVLEKKHVISNVHDLERIANVIYSQNEEDISENDNDKNDIKVYTYPILNSIQAASLGSILQNITKAIFIFNKQQGNEITYLVYTPSLPVSTKTLQSIIQSINTDQSLREVIKNISGVELLSANSADPVLQVANSRVEIPKEKTWDKITLTTVLICGCVLATFILSAAICLIRSNSKGAPVILKKQEAVQDYQELLRTQMSIINLPKPDDKLTEKEASMKQAWSEDSIYKMDITTGHVILAYMEDHLKNDNRLNKEWEALCNYRPDDTSVTQGSEMKNAIKNRYRDILPYDHSRVKLNPMTNALHSDYINASFITNIRDVEYIAAQGPLYNTVSDFWQMIWEQGVVIIVNLTRLSDMGLPLCHRYWPEDGSEIYHIYEVHLISEHIWCDDYLVRSLYLKNMQTSETRTVTQFHYLTWPDLSVPISPKSLLDFRRKVNKCYRGHARPIVVHCNNGVGRTGTYILLDMILNKMIKGAKEIDIAAAIEHLRDQRADMVKTKGQFDFALMAMAEEVTAILSSVSR
ncbi:receptor-type tyrosine-protein phosphatase N2 isoform X2 [Hydra vulgaris]|uniref:Receptor-type tyrosine-protein phosphatase N2 isoform X2 n=1 Tax=Hydra vulgaris TaxID=6087 RepID=A0ABM4CX85_HYDVU